MNRMLTAPTRLRLSRPQDRLSHFQNKLERPLSDQQRERILARIAAAQKALAAPLQLTERDLDILQALARFRFMSSHQIIRYLTGLSDEDLKQQLDDKPWAYQQILRRLSSLFDRHFITRPSHQDLTSFGPLIYGLTTAGARELSARGFPVNAQIDWQLKNSRASGLFTQHTLETTQAMLLFDAACRAQEDLRPYDHHDLIATLPASDRKDPFHLPVTINTATEPFAYRRSRSAFRDPLPGQIPQRVALELDRGTMDITSKRLSGKASFVRKLTAYYGAFRQNKFIECWNTTSLRVLTITTANKQIANMCAAQHTVTQGHANDLFLYTTFERLASHGPFGNSWMRADGTVTSILRA